jgi:hypothetical protein
MFFLPAKAAIPPDIYLQGKLPMERIFRFIILAPKNVIDNF